MSNNCIVPEAAITIHLAHQKRSHEKGLSFAKSHLLWSSNLFPSPYLLVVAMVMSKRGHPII